MLQVRIKKKLGNFLLDVDFSMDGGIFAILGASGCGKSMTLKCTRVWAMYCRYRTAG